jgi:hypothetical protein
MSRKNRGFPLEYYPGEILTEREAVINRKMFMFRVTGMGGALTPNVSVMLPPPTAISRIHFTSLDSMVSQTKPSSLIAPVSINQPDKSILKDLQLDEFNQISSKFLDGSISMDEAILQLRGGGKFKDISLIVLYIWLYRLQNNHVEGFQTIRPPHQEWMPKGADHRPGWGLDRPNPFQPPSAAPRFSPYYDSFSPRRTTTPSSILQVTPPTTMPHEEFVGLTKEERRALPHSNDMKIIHEGRPELVVGFWQSKFKVGDHGAVHDLPYTIKANSGMKTEKTDENALKMMQSVVDMPNRGNVKWFEDGTYQGGSDREFEAIHIYDLANQVIAVFKKSTGKFVTTCQ